MNRKIKYMEQKKVRIILNFSKNVPILLYNKSINN